jgi:OmcA/MtrC family decaheme c-type cytochrome
MEKLMRTPTSVFAVGRWIAVLSLIAGTAALMTGDKKKVALSPNEKAYYASANLVAYVQPGLLFNIVSASITSGGTISVHYKVTDPNGAPLDVTGVTTPGTISVSYLAAYIGAGKTEYTSYITKLVAAATGPASATQVTSDSGGTLQTVAVGEYIYTYKTLASGVDMTASHRVGIYGSRNLTTWDLGTNYADATYDFVPNGAKITVVRDIVRTPDCNVCHGSAATSTGSDGLAEHGGSRRDVQLCIICHQPQTSDPNTGNTLDFPVMIHKIHMGSSLPSVVAGGEYDIVGYQNSVNNFSGVVYPADVRRCQTCHNPKNGAAQTTAWMTTPNRAACGACHDDVNFATGANHPAGPETDDTQCAVCHIPQGTQEFDASIIGAHTIPVDSVTAPGINLTITHVTNGVAGKAPTVTFTIKDNGGNAIPMSAMTASPNELALVLAGPTSDYGYTNFGSDVTTSGYVSENPVPTASCGADGTCNYTFTHAIPAKATGTYAVGIEGRRALSFPASTGQAATEYGAINQVFYFSVDGSPVTPRRTVVAIANCNACHAQLSLHGGLRNQIEMCVLCHNPSDTDSSTRATATVASDKTLPPQGINFAMMVHKIHTGVNQQVPYIIVGYGGSHNDFSTVLYPTMGPSGTTGDTTQCYMCHVNGTEQVLPIGKNAVTDPQGILNPSPATTSACTACHNTPAAISHAQQNTDPKFGESCDICHGATGAYAATQVHAGQ